MGDLLRSYAGRIAASWAHGVDPAAGASAPTAHATSTPSFGYSWNHTSDALAQGASAAAAFLASGSELGFAQELTLFLTLCTIALSLMIAYKFYGFVREVCTLFFGVVPLCAVLVLIFSAFRNGSYVNTAIRVYLAKLTNTSHIE